MNQLSGIRAAFVFSTRSSEAPVKALSRVSPRPGELAGCGVPRHLQVSNAVDRSPEMSSLQIDCAFPVARTEPRRDFLTCQGGRNIRFDAEARNGHAPLDGINALCLRAGPC